MRIIPLLGLALLGAASAKPAGAQSPVRFSSALDLGALMQRDGVDQWQSATRLAPALHLDQRWAQFGLDGSLLGSAHGLALDHALMQAAISPAPIGMFRWSADARSERLASAAYAPKTAITAQTSLSMTLGDGGVWLGAALERSPQIDTLPTRPLLRFGVWRRFGGALVSISSSSHALRTGGRAPTSTTRYYPDSVYNDTLGAYNYFQRPRTQGDSGQASRLQRWSDLQLSTSWAGGPLALDASFGVRQAFDAYPRALWTRLTAAIQVTPAVAVIASGGNDPARLALGIPQTRVASLGVRVSSVALLRTSRDVPVRTTAAAFSLQCTGANSYVVSIRVPRARTVELSGDFGHWQSTSLTETRPDVWETTVTLPAGTYRMNVRVDGDKWKAPPGLPTVDDEFNGTVGIVVVR